MTSSPFLTIVGLGPGTWDSLTVEAADVLRAASEVYVRTAIQPSIEPIRERLPDSLFQSFDGLYEALSSLDEVYRRIADQVLELARRPGGVVYAVPGSPWIGETTVRLLLERAEDEGIEVRVVPGLSYLEGALAAVGAADTGWVQALDASEVALLAGENAVGESPQADGLLAWRAPVCTAPLVVSYLYSRDMASAVKGWLSRFYPDDHTVQLIEAPGTGDTQVQSVPLYEIDRERTIDDRTVLYVPPLTENDNVRTFGGLMQLTRRLRGPGGCPWDREQSHATLKPHLVEETYEVLDALDSGDPELLAEEFGDLLFQITIHSQIAAEHGEFTIEDVIGNIMCKLIGRHPHVFGDVELESAHDVRQVWEALKQKEKPKRTSILQEIPRGLPALPQSNLMQKRAASVGFEWPSVSEVIDKVDEELQELRQEIDSGRPKELQREELGDIFFALVSVARHLRIDPEEALRLANRKFATRFQYVESRAAAEGKVLRDLSPQHIDDYWNAAKESVSANGE